MFGITLRHAESCGNEKGIGVFHSFIANFSADDIDGMGLFRFHHLQTEVSAQGSGCSRESTCFSWQKREFVPRMECVTVR